jgi:hypothetical protein
MVEPAQLPLEIHGLAKDLHSELRYYWAWKEYKIKLPTGTALYRHSYIDKESRKIVLWNRDGECLYIDRQRPIVLVRGED